MTSNGAASKDVQDGGGLSSYDVPIAVRITASMNRALTTIENDTGRKRADLIREAINALIGMYRNASSR